MLQLIINGATIFDLITALSPISAQSSNFLVKILDKIYSASSVLLPQTVSMNSTGSSYVKYIPQLWNSLNSVYYTLFKEFQSWGIYFTYGDYTVIIHVIT